MCFGREMPIVATKSDSSYSWHAKKLISDWVHDYIRGRQTYETTVVGI